jgi:hypothetical protein
MPNCFTSIFKFFSYSPSFTLFCMAHKGGGGSCDAVKFIKIQLTKLHHLFPWKNSCHTLYVHPHQISVQSTSKLLYKSCHKLSLKYVEWLNRTEKATVIM